MNLGPYKKNINHQNQQNHQNNLNHNSNQKNGSNSSLNTAGTSSKSKPNDGKSEENAPKRKQSLFT